MKGRKITQVNAARVAILILGGLLGTAVADPAVTGRPGQRGEGRAGGVARFTELPTAEHHSGGPPSGSRAERPHSRPSPGRRPAVPASLSPSSDSDPAATLADADSLFSPASGGVSPSPAASFPALLDNATSFNPDTQGAVGPDHVVTMLASEVRIHNRQGATISTVSLRTFWGSLVNSNVFDPRVLYDSFEHRWIATALADPGSSSRALLIAVSQSSDPTGNWYPHSIPAGLEGDVFPEGPNVGLTKDWITVQVNTFDNTNFYFYSSEIRVFDKARLYSGASAQFTFFRDTNAINEANAAVPAVNYDSNYATNFLVANWFGNAAGAGYLRMYSISGPVGAEVFNDYGPDGLLVFGSPVNPPWDDFSPTNRLNFAPQQGTTNRIYIGDARMQDVVYRNGSLWCAQHVFLPISSEGVIPNRCSVQWWVLTTGGTVLQRGRIDDSSGLKSFAYPSIAVNQYEDVLIGYTRFGSNQFPSANYSFRGFEDAFSTMRGDAVLKAGEAKFFVADDNGFNRWGDWSATVVDPVNDADLWTIQEYASVPKDGSDRWGTWWGKFGPPTSLSVVATDSPDPVVAGGNVTYSIRVTNNFPLLATGVRVVATLPAGSAFVSAVTSQGSCSNNNGVVTCAVGDITDSAFVTATVVARLNQSGQATCSITTLGNGPDESPADNTVQVTTTVTPASDVAVLVSGSPDPVTLGNTLTYAVVVTNLGPSSAAGVSLTNTLPPGVTYLSATPSQGTCSQSGGIVRCTILSVNAGAFVNVAIAIRPLVSGFLTNRAQVGTTGLDPNAANNSTTTVTKASAAPTLQTIADRTINEDTVMGPVTFTVSDPETPAAGLTVAAFSSNQAIVPNANISLAVLPGTGGTNRTITITPLPNANGKVTNTVTVTDQDGISTSTNFVLTINQINDAPTISDIANQFVNEDLVLGPISFTVGDIETAPGTLTVSAASLNTTLIPNGNIQLGPPGSATRTVTITPATNQSGTATIQITVSDGITTTNDTFTVTVNEVNDLPTISDITNRTILEDGTTGLISFTVGDVETAAASLSPSGTSSNPTLVPNGNITFGGTGANRTVTVRPATNEFGNATITVFIADGSGGSTNDTFVLTVNPVNDPPTLDTIAVLNIPEDPGLQIVTLTNITGGPTNEPQTIEVTAVSDNPALLPNPILVNYSNPAATGTLSFTPVANSNGTAVITLTARDGGTSNNIITRTITVNVAAVNDSPTLADIGDRTIDEDASTGLIPVSIGDVDSPLASLSISGSSSDTSLVPNANIVPGGGTGAGRTLSITPAPDRFGSATITVFVTDGATTNSDTFVLTVRSVNDAPVISGIANRSIDEDTSTNISFTISDAETSAADLNLSARSTNPALFPGISFGGTGTDRTINLLPAENQAGNVTITVTVTDGDSASNSVTFTVEVVDVNDPPTLTRPGDLTIAEDAFEQTVILSGITSGAPNESQLLAVRAASSNPALIPTPVISYTSANLTGILTFTPAPDASGSATLSVSVSDGGATNTQSFTVTVLPVNDAPVLPEITDRQIDEDTTATVNFYVNDAETPADQLVIQIGSSNPELLDETGIQLTGTGTNRTLLLTPLPDASGSSTFITVNVTDGSNEMAATSFELTVRPVNDLPTLGGLTNRTVNKSDVATTLNLPFTVSDPESLPSALTVTASSSNPALVANSSLSISGNGTTRTLNLTVTAGQSGSTLLTLVAKDGPLANAGSTTNTFVLKVNDLPTLSSIGPRTMKGNTTSNFTFTVTDAETPASGLSVLATSANQGLVPDAGLNVSDTGNTRTLSVTPVFGQSGTSTISLVALDTDGGRVTNSFLLTVLRVDVPPVLSNIADTNVIEDATLVVPFMVGDAENPPQALTLGALSSNQALLPLSGIVFGGSLSNRTVALTPAANQSGVVTVTVTVTDTNGGVASDAFVLTVIATNDPPTLSALPSLTIDEDSATGPLSITVGDVETPAANLTLTAISSNTGLVPNGNVVPGGLGANRTVVITPLANQSGSTLITLTLTDGEGGSTNTSFTLAVAAVNDPPTLNVINDLTIAEDSGPRAVALAGISAGGGETQTLTFSVLSANTNLIPSGTVNYTNGSPTAVLTFPTAADTTGTSLLTVQINDGGTSNNIVARTFQVTVTNINDAPAISDIPNQTTVEDVSLTVPFVINDRETPALSLALTATSTNTALVANTNILFNGSGTNRSLTIVPSLNATGTTLITISVGDGATNAVDSFVLTVTPVNDPPTLDSITNTTVTASGGGGGPTAIVNLTGISAGAANESQSLTISATANPAMSTAPVASISGTGPTGTVTLRPGNNIAGSWLVTVTVSDGQASVVRTFTFTSRASGNVLPTISIIPAQTINEDGVISALPFTVRDAETNAANLTVVAVSTNETLVPNANISLGVVPGTGGTNRTITVTPAPNQSGTTAIRLTVRDGNNGASNMTFNVTVNPVNDPPTIQLISNQSTGEDTPAGPIQVLVSDVESPAGSLTVTATSANQALVPNANLLVGGSGTNRALMITPAANQTGSTVITVNVSDGSASINTQFTLTVNAVNDPPTISDIADQTINEDTAPLVIPFNIGDVETPATGLTLTFDSSNTNLAPLGFALGGAGSSRTLTVTPAANLFGVTTVTLSVSDGTNQTSDTFVLTINPTNDAPTLNLIADQSVPLNAAEQTINLTGISSGASNENQTLIVAASSSNPSVVPHPRVNYTSPAATGSLTVSPVRDARGSATITVTVNDGQPNSNSVTRTFTVTILESGPALRIEHLGGMAVVSWTTNSPGVWMLQSAADVLDAAGWSRVATAPVVVNDRYTVTNAPGSAMRVYRLCSECVAGGDPASPTLVINRSGTQVLLSWPAAAGNFALEETTVLGPSVLWSSVTKAPALANGRLTVTIGAADRKFYRLRNQ